MPPIGSMPNVGYAANDLWAESHAEVIYHTPLTPLAQAMAFD